MGLEREENYSNSRQIINITYTERVLGEQEEWNRLEGRKEAIGRTKKLYHHGARGSGGKGVGMGSRDSHLVCSCMCVHKQAYT